MQRHELNLTGTVKDEVMITCIKSPIIDLQVSVHLL